jgi:hypothetical protein
VSAREGSTVAATDQQNYIAGVSTTAGRASRQTPPKQQLQLKDRLQTKQQPLQQQEHQQQSEEPRKTTPKQQLEQEDKQ